MGLYALLTVFFLFLVYQLLEEGPASRTLAPVTVSGGEL
jgi:hypothetical protein